jgi:hypothetical protein
VHDGAPVAVVAVALASLRSQLQALRGTAASASDVSRLLAAVDQLKAEVRSFAGVCIAGGVISAVLIVLMSARRRRAASQVMHPLCESIAVQSIVSACLNVQCAIIIQNHSTAS